MGFDLGRVAVGIATGGLSEQYRAAKEAAAKAGVNLPGLPDVGGLGQTDYRPAGYDPNPQAFTDPLAGPESSTAQILAHGAFDQVGPDAINRPAPQAANVVYQGAQAAPVTAAPVADARKQQFDLGLLAPGLGVTQGALDASGQTRGQQEGNLIRLGMAANGQVPSAAEAQQRAGLASILRNNLALAASSRGTAANQVATTRAALDRNSDASLQASGQAAALRAQEQAVARGQLTDALTGVRGQDLGGAQIGLGVLGTGAQVGTAQLGSDTQTGIANLGKDTQLSGLQLQADTALGLGNLTSATQTGIAKGNSDTTIAQANINSILQSRSLDDNTKLQYLAALMGIDARTQEGAIALERLKAQIAGQKDQLTTQIELANAGVVPQLVGGGLNAIGTTAVAAIG